MVACLVRFELKMAELSMYKSKSQKVKRDYSCHGRYKGIHLVFSLFSLHSSWNKRRTGPK